MVDLNSVVLTGRIVKNAELKKAGDKSVAAFAIAVNRMKKKKDGSGYEPSVSFVNLALFGKSADGLFPYLLKGTTVGVEAHLEQTSWEKDGEHYSNLMVRVDKFTLLGSPSDKKHEAPVPETYDFQEGIDKVDFQ